jgi:tetratricopeptide (TPR) repeat protein
MSKAIVVTLPLIMMLLDYWPLDRYGLHAESPEREHQPAFPMAMKFLKGKIPFIACSLIAAIITINVPTYSDVSQARLAQIPLAMRFANALTAYLKYVAKTFWPADLAVHYPFPAAIPVWQVVGSLLVLIATTAAVIRYGRRHPYLVTGWFWFLVMLAPVLGIIPIGDHAIADRYTYLSMTGLLIAGAWGINALTSKLPNQRLILAVVAGFLIPGAAFMTHRQIRYWHDSVSLFRNAVQVTSNNDIAHTNLGDGLLEKGYLDEAIREYQEALKIQRNNYFAHNGLGVAYHKKGYLDEAIKAYQTALMINPDYSDAKRNLGVALQQRQQSNKITVP